MGFLVSPGVDVNEVDLTNVIPAVSTSIGGIVGHFKWGPVEEVLSVGSEKELVANFGKPDTNTYKQWFQAAAFLQYGNALNVYRTIPSESPTLANNASSGGGTFLVKNSDNYLSQTLSTSNFVARYPGALGNSLEVCVITSGNYAATANSIAKAAVRGAPTAGEIHIVILDEDGDITGTADTVLEVFSDLTVVNTGDYKRDDGTSRYYVDVLETQSAWVWPTATIISATDNDSPTTETDNYNFSLSAGADSTASTTLEMSNVYATAFGDADTIDVNILIGPAGVDSQSNATTAANNVNTVAKLRKDCVAVVSPPTTGAAGTALQALASTAVTNATTWAAAVSTTSYGILHIYRGIRLRQVQRCLSLDWYSWSRCRSSCKR